MGGRARFAVGVSTAPWAPFAEATASAAHATVSRRDESGGDSRRPKEIIVFNAFTAINEPTIGATDHATQAT
jgi:hypothetical protein